MFLLFGNVSILFPKPFAATIACNRLWWTLAVEQASFQSSVPKRVLNGYDLCGDTTLLWNILKIVALYMVTMCVSS